MSNDVDWRNRAHKYMLDLSQAARDLNKPGRKHEDPDKALIMVSLQLILERLIEDNKAGLPKAKLDDIQE